MKSTKNVVRLIAFARSVVFVAGVMLLLLPDPAQSRGLDLIDVRGHLPDLKFNLVSDSGKAVSERDFRGLVTLVYFGYTSCPDECPTTLTKLSDILATSAGLSADVRVLFVSIDPTVDTPQRLHAYLDHFDPSHMVGLTGDEAAIESFAKRYRAAYRSRTSAMEEPTHADAIYVFDKDGVARQIVSDETGDDVLGDSLKRLVAEASLK